MQKNEFAIVEVLVVIAIIATLIFAAVSVCKWARRDWRHSPLAVSAMLADDRYSSTPPTGGHTKPVKKCAVAALCITTLATIFGQTGTKRVERVVDKLQVGSPSHSVEHAQLTAIRPSQLSDDTLFHKVQALLVDAKADIANGKMEEEQDTMAEATECARAMKTADSGKVDALCCVAESYLSTDRLLSRNLFENAKDTTRLTSGPERPLSLMRLAETLNRVCSPEAARRYQGYAWKAYSTLPEENKEDILADMKCGDQELADKAEPGCNVLH